MFTEQFFKQSGVIPTDWTLSKKPVVNDRMAQLSFKNGLNIVAQPRTIGFSEGVTANEPKELKLPEVASNFIQVLRHAEYQNLSISPKMIVPLGSDPDAGRKYITETLIAPGPWQRFGTEPVQANINLLYQLEGCQLSLSINEARLQAPNRGPIPALLFAGNFNYNFANLESAEKLDQIGRKIKNTQQDFDTYRKIIQENFLPSIPSEEDSLFAG